LTAGSLQNDVRSAPGFVDDTPMTKKTLIALLEKDLDSAAYGQEYALLLRIFEAAREEDSVDAVAGLAQRRIDIFAQIRKELGIRCSPRFRDSAMNDVLVAAFES
jgi:hypothetical protein